MRTYALSHVSDPELRRGLSALVSQDRATTAMLLAHIAEFDARRLYLPAAYPSMYTYCVHELHLSEDAAYKRITAARVARRFPVIFEAVSDGRLHLASVSLLAPHLTLENAGELLAGAAHRSKSEVEVLLANRFPRTETLELVQAMSGSALLPDSQLAPGRVASGNPDRPLVCEGQLAARQVEAEGSAQVGAADQLAPGQVDIQGSQSFGAPTQLAPGRVEPRCKIAPVAADRFLVQLTIGRPTHDKLRHARNLLGHSLPSGDLAQVLDRALDALIEKLERRKFARAVRPRQSSRPSKRTRHIPAHVRRTVWERDSGQCTFVSDSGRRCSSRKCLEFDHVEPLARGGRATVAGIQLRCRAHNQCGAERAFGAEFMRGRREAAQHSAVARRAALVRRQKIQTSSMPAMEDVIAPLRGLGFSSEESRRAAALCETIPEASLEQRLRRALEYFQPRRRMSAPCDSSEAIVTSG